MEKIYGPVTINCGIVENKSLYTYYFYRNSETIKVVNKDEEKVKNRNHTFRKAENKSLTRKPLILTLEFLVIISDVNVVTTYFF